jgi:hypothetical protein
MMGFCSGMAGKAWTAGVGRLRAGLVVAGVLLAEG